MIDPGPALTFRRFYILLLVVFLTYGVAASASDSGGWVSVRPAPTARTEVAAAVVGTTIYVVGGFEHAGGSNPTAAIVSDRVEAYDALGDRWTTKTSLPVALHHAGIAAVGGRLYVIGGFRQLPTPGWHPVATVYVYDPHDDRWTEGAPMPTPRGALSVTELEGKLYAIGGLDGRGDTSAVEEYDPASDRWSVRAPLPTPRDHLATATAAGRIYAIGGRQADNLAVTEMYDPAANHWSRRADLPTPRSGITAGVIDGTIYVVGGESATVTFSTNEAYRPDTDRWTSMASMPTARHGLGSGVVRKRMYVIAGGPTPGFSFTAVNEMFAPPSEP